jgi:hypothetical protein
MTNLNYGQNVVYFLNDLAASEVSDITSGEFESYGEDGQGRDASCSIDITLLAADAVSMIAALQEQVQALSAENCIQDFIIAAVKDLVRDSEGVSGWHLNGDIATWDQVLPELSHSETPATDAVIREIGAKAVEQLSREAHENGAHGVAMIATKFAAKLRAGEQP